jgi:choline dehydrogenase-like flavoprotein
MYDVILSGGALYSPHLLMLSGIGPAEELKKHGIPVVQDLPDIGKNLQDHCFSTAVLLQRPGTDDRSEFEGMSPEAMAATRAQHTKDKKSILSSLYCSVPMGWFKNDAVYMSEEFKALDKHTQEFLKKPHVPIYELATVSPIPRRRTQTANSILSMLHRYSLATTSSNQKTATSQVWRF